VKFNVRALGFEGYKSYDSVEAFIETLNNFLADSDLDEYTFTMFSIKREMDFNHGFRLIKNCLLTKSNVTSRDLMLRTHIKPRTLRRYLRYAVYKHLLSRDKNKKEFIYRLK
jgi:hypothetical protein